MSFCAALQSALFYVASCTPCRQARYQRKQAATAKEQREEKERLRAEYPDAYQHPDPFNTNPYWSEEIMMGPHIEARKYMSNKSTSQRNLNSAGNDKASAAGSTVVAGSLYPESSPTVVAEDNTLSLSTSVSEDWNKKRYQREDEELWGHEFSRAGHRLMDAIKQAGSSAHRRIEASLGMEPKHVTEEDRTQFYFAPKHPPVNDYHPPIVRQRPAHKDAHKWMLQPPPAAKVMEGKVPVSRTGSMASHLSRGTAISDSPALGRLVHERAMEAKLRSGELSAGSELTLSRSRPDSRRKNTGSTYRQSWQSAGSNTVSMESSDASEGRAKRRAKRRTRPPMMTPEMESSSEDDDDFYQLKSAEPNSKSGKAARRPKLRTITSSRESGHESPTTALHTTTAGDSKTPRSAADASLEIIEGLPALPPPALQANDRRTTMADEDEASTSTKPPGAAHPRSEMPI